MRHISLSLFSLYSWIPNGTCNNINTRYGFRFDQHEQHSTSDFEDISLENLLGIHHRIDVFWCEKSGMCSTISFILQLIVHYKIILVP